ncbi:dihydrodipicolinate synthase family protein [Saccharopolyspora dendranthemae]|uniref:4-hydroxy-tetrahydrodipicolinate synthase n=1 Tax=Saccharopolyspora dendranthemae TaxID=1181886 RepID=A0A561U1Z6_9PSEU|nr:dihydrodipicolinate synthase family protein [Saccharopolyspora dendranthemae]TWF93381.1 4-hydroxy-tetrahydrodipicolinate synthase [Saccharopolyspora dendranthemae]
MTTAAITGVVPPVCTPLTPELDVDTASLERLLHFLIEAGVDGLFVLGSSGETAYLDDEQRATVIDVATSVAAGQVPVIAGAIDMTAPRVLAHARSAARAGVDAVVATAPFYTRTHPAEVEHHFRTVAAGVDVPLYAYDLPVSVHTKLSAQLLLRLAEDGVITGVKDSSGDDAGLRRLLQMRGERGPVVLTGSELTVDNALANGADGVVPGLGNVDPHGYLALARHVRDGDLKAAAAEQDRLADLFRMVEAGDPARIGPSSAGLGSFKAALHLRGIIDCPATMPPQLPLAEQEVATIRTLLDQAGLL